MRPGVCLLPDMNGMPGPKRVVILGGGFGGVYTALALERLARTEPGQVEVTLVSQDNYLLMTPLLFEASSGILEPRHAVQPIRSLLEQARFVEAEVEKIDLEKRVVFARPSPDEVYELPYDFLVLSLGGVTNRQIIPGSEHAMTFKTIADAIFLRNYTIELFERADVERNPQRKKALLSFVIIGAGLVGVELMGELTIFTRNLCRSYPGIDPEELRFELLEAGPEIMGEMDRDLIAYTVQVLEERGVRIRTNCPAKRIDLDRVELSDGQTILAETIILSTGVAPNPLLKDLPLAKDRKGRVAVDPAMRSVSHPEVWALGDCAAIPDPQGKPYPQLAQHALREAKVLGENIMGAIHQRPLKPFAYETLGTLAALGHYKGVGRIRRMKFRGFVAWWIWRTYYLLQMPQWDRRLRIMLDWTLALFFKNDIVKLALFGEEHPLRKYEERIYRRTPPAEEVLDWTITPADGREDRAQRQESGR